MAGTPPVWKSREECHCRRPHTAWARVSSKMYFIHLKEGPTQKKINTIFIVGYIQNIFTTSPCHHAAFSDEKRYISQILLSTKQPDSRTQELLILSCLNQLVCQLGGFPSERTVLARKSSGNILNIPNT